MKKGLEKRGNKKAVSPVVATVLLIVMVVVIGLIIFLWFRSLTEEAVTKFGGTNIQLVCDDVMFLVQYDSVGEVLSVSNIGNVPIYDINLRITEGRKYETKSVRDILPEKWPQHGLGRGESFSGSLKETISGGSEVLAIPVLIGTAAGERRTHVCDDRHSLEVIF